MKDLTVPQKTMSSIELVKIINDMREDGQAELRRDHFMTKVLKVLGEEVALNFRGIYLDAYKREKPCFNLPKRECNLMVMSESYKVQAAVYDKLAEFEAQPALNPANLSRLQLIQLALEAEQELQEAKQEIAVLEPKAQALDRIATESEGALNITNSAKTLQLQPKKLISWMQANKWIYKRAGGKSWVAYQDKIQSGVLEHKITTVLRGDGTEKMAEQVLVTAKGLTKLSSVVQTLN